MIVPMLVPKTIITYPVHYIPRLCMTAPWVIGQHSQLMSPYNSNASKPNFTKRGCEDSLDIVVITVVLVFRNSSSFPRSGRPKTAGSEFSLKNGLFEPQKFGGPIFMRVPPLTQNTAKTSFGEDLVKYVQPLLSSRIK